MKASTSVSTTFAAAHNRHQVGILVTLAGDQPVERPPINVALVLDRSGSMSGEPLAAARDAALRFASFLTARDRLSVVAFDDDVDLLFGPGPGNDPAAERAIRRITERGSTNLSGGWIEGHRQVSRGLLQGTNRVILLTDGQANEGIVDPQALRSLAIGAAENRVSTTCIGFGPAFNEDLLQAMAEGGNGRFWYVENPDQMTGSFEGEVEGLVSLAAQNLSVEVTLTHPGVAGVTIVPELPAQRTDDGAWRVKLGDLYAVQPRSVGFIFHVENADQLGAVELGSIAVRADLIRPDGVEHRTTTLPVMATLDGQDHVSAEVESAFLRFAVAKAREEAVRQADQGDLKQACRTLHDAAQRIPPDSSDAELLESRNDLLAEASRLKEEVYRPEDRKYNLASAAYVREGRHEKEKLIRRKRR
jgi:Ca-activated chloride channel family protein